MTDDKEESGLQIHKEFSLEMLASIKKYCIYENEEVVGVICWVVLWVVGDLLLVLMRILFSRRTNNVSLWTFLASYGWESNLMAAKKH